MSCVPDFQVLFLRANRIPVQHPSYLSVHVVIVKVWNNCCYFSLLLLFSPCFYLFLLLCITTVYLLEEEFVRYFEHLETLSFADTPDYAHLKALFRDLFRKKGFGYDSILYDWEIKSHQLQQLQQQH